MHSRKYTTPASPPKKQNHFTCPQHPVPGRRSLSHGLRLWRFTSVSSTSRLRPWISHSSCLASVCSSVKREWRTPCQNAGRIKWIGSHKAFRTAPRANKQELQKPTQRRRAVGKRPFHPHQLGADEDSGAGGGPAGRERKGKGEKGHKGLWSPGAVPWRPVGGTSCWPDAPEKLGKSTVPRSDILEGNKHFSSWSFFFTHQHRGSRD